MTAANGFHWGIWRSEMDWGFVVLLLRRKLTGGPSGGRGGLFLVFLLLGVICIYGGGDVVTATARTLWWFLGLWGRLGWYDITRGLSLCRTNANRESFVLKVIHVHSS